MSWIGGNSKTSIKQTTMSSAYQKYLASIVECQEKNDSSIKHEWLFTNKSEAVRVANYLRGHGYPAQVKTKTVIYFILFYVGVPFELIKNQQP
jgi:uncharacterized membrane protein YbaN (DUF454 family)